MKVDDDLARQVITPRLRESHKGSYGRVLLVGGLYPYGGAIIMAAIACVNMGQAWSQWLDRENITALHAHLPEAMAFDLRETERFLEILGQLMWY
ncbi:MAG: NAD(P)H-hydrate dehydratase [Streptococcus salivarius]